MTEVRSISHDPAIDARHIVRSFGRRPVLEDVSLEVAPGEVVGITGENGSGKTTLMRIILGLLAPDSGDVVIRGRVGYCPQSAALFDRLTVRENFAYFASAYGLSTAGEEPSWTRRMAVLLERLQFTQYERMAVSSLSGGTMQKLNLSIALLHEPDVLLLDEPYSGFDWETYLHFWDMVDELRVSGTSLLIVSHLVYDRTRFDRILELKDGRL